MKRNLYITLGIILTIIIGGAIWGYTRFDQYAPETYVIESKTGSSTVNATTGTVTPSVQSFTMTDVATHKDATSCYAAISGSVYDLTMWVNLHPGGKNRILSLCGTDGTQQFMNKHQGGEKYMTILARFKIGTFTQ